MWTEVVKVKPTVDQASATKMESDLNSRFVKVGKRFSGAVTRFTKVALGGSIIGGIGLGLINKILNPLEKIDARIKEILAEGQDTADTAEKFGGTPAQLFQLQKVAEVAGVKPEDVRKMLDEFKSKQVLARQEILNPDQDRHRSTEVLGNDLAKNENTIEAFIQFMKDLQKKTLAERTVAERAVFGEKQTGGDRRLIDTNFDEVTAKLRIGDIGPLEETLRRNTDIAAQDREQKGIVTSQSFLSQSQKISPDVITNINTREFNQQQRLTNQMSSLPEFQQLQATADRITVALDKATELIGQILVKADTAVQHMQTLTQSRTIRISPTGQVRYE